MATGGASDGLGNSNDRVRKHNLSVVLQLVHHSRGIPRSSLTRQTGLNRSTIAALVGELVDLHLLVEAEPDASKQVGRPSPLALPAPDAAALAVNPEIDAITVALVGLGGEVISRVRRPVGSVPSVADAVAIASDAVAHLVADAGAAHTIVGIGVAVPGLVRARDGVVRLAPHLGWVDEPVAEALAQATGYRVTAGNDANAGTVAESIFGAGAGVDDLIYLNGGASGIGGGIMSSGRILGGVDGYAGEFGHTQVVSGGALCHCGGTGCLETEVRRDRLLALLGLADADGAELETALLASDAPEVRAEVERQLDFLAVALRNAINTLNPSRVILAGFLGSLYAVAPARLDELVATQPLLAPRESVTIVRSELAENRLMIGAAELAFAGVLADPAGFQSTVGRR